MWVTCNACSGKGFHMSCDKTYSYKVWKTIPCKVCNPLNTFFNEYMRGQIWIDDNYEPISPPSSP